MAVILSYQAYQHLSQPQPQVEVIAPEESLPLVMSLEEAFGSVTPINQPEDFVALREAAIEEHMQKVMEDMDGWTRSF